MVKKPAQKQASLTGFFAPAPKRARVVSENEDVGVRDDVTPRMWKMVSWNVAGLRACLKKDCTKTLKSLDADLIFLGETKYDAVQDYSKLKKDDLKHMDEFKKSFSDYHLEWCVSATEKKGYAGVALLTKVKPIKVTTGIGCPEFDAAGRIIFAEFSNFHFIGAYVMNSGRQLVNLNEREKWESLFLERIKSLDADKPVVYGGDLNVAHNEIDLRNPDSNRNKTAGFTDKERSWFSDLLSAGFTDSYRKLHPDVVKYSFWSYLGNARSKDIGWRLDYWLVSNRIMENVQRSDILSEVTGSDHAPVILEITI